MKRVSMDIPFCQIVIAIVFLCLYSSSDIFDHFISNPWVAYPIMLAFGFANATSKYAFEVGTKRRDALPRLQIRDLLVFTAFVGMSIAISRAMVEYDNSILHYCGLVLPSTLVLWLHWRCSLSPLVATLMHYVISLTWAFSAGLIYYQHFNEIYRNDSSRRLRSPIREGMESLAEMAELGIVTSSIYFVVTTIFLVVLQRQRIQKQLKDQKPSQSG